MIVDNPAVLHKTKKQFVVFAGGPFLVAKHSRRFFAVGWISHFTTIVVPTGTFVAWISTFSFDDAAIGNRSH